jgi:hypothetical protein
MQWSINPSAMNDMFYEMMAGHHKCPHALNLNLGTVTSVMDEVELKGVPGGAKRKAPEKEKSVVAEVWLW